jgi:CRISPR-associated protein Csd1
LIAKQAYHDKASGQVFVTWAIGGQPIPDPLANTEKIFSEMPQELEPEPQYTGDAGQHFALRLKKLIAGYSTRLGRTDGIVVMGLDSASPGRMAITFYRELNGTEFLERVLAWHQECAWYQNFSKQLQFIGAPAPKDIAEAAYGKQVKGISGEKLRNATVERLLPCIVDGRPIPRDLVRTCVRRVCNRVGSTKWEWEKCLGVACALYKGLHKEESYQMSLEEERTSRDYLFGRLLALAEHLEQRALYVAGEKRDSNAEKLMQRFADRPSSTWRNIEIALAPYKARLRVKRPGTLRLLQEELDAVTCKFRPGDFNDDKLSGEFLLGYHCQRAALWTKSDNDNGEAVEDELIREGE